LFVGLWLSFSFHSPFWFYFFCSSAEGLPDQNNIRFHLKNEDSTLPAPRASASSFSNKNDPHRSADKITKDNLIHEILFGYVRGWRFSPSPVLNLEDNAWNKKFVMSLKLMTQTQQF